MTPGYLDGPHHEKRPDPNAPTIAGEKHEKPHHGKQATKKR